MLCLNVKGAFPDLLPLPSIPDNIEFFFFALVGPNMLDNTGFFFCNDRDQTQGPVHTKQKVNHWST
jgi:hypothetical protein